MEAGVCTEDTWLRGGGERSSTKTFTELALKGAERHLLLSKAPCCPKPARSSHTAGSWAGEERAPGVLTKSPVYFSSLGWLVAGTHWRDPCHRSRCSVLRRHAGALCNWTWASPSLQMILLQLPPGFPDSRVSLAVPCTLLSLSEAEITLQTGPWLGSDWKRMVDKASSGLSVFATFVKREELHTQPAQVRCHRHPVALIIPSYPDEMYSEGSCHWGQQMK